MINRRNRNNQSARKVATQTMSPAKRFFFARIFPLIFVLIGGSVVFWGVNTFFKANQSEAWPFVDGIIVESEMEYHRSNEGSGTYHARILYDYTVGGVLYSGDQVAYGDYGSSDSSHARSIVNRYPKGQSVLVYYDPNQPEESVLERGIQAQIFFLPAFGLVFLIAGLIMMIYLPKSLPPVTDRESDK